MTNGRQRVRVKTSVRVRYERSGFQGVAEVSGGHGWRFGLRSFLQGRTAMVDAYRFPQELREAARSCFDLFSVFDFCVKRLEKVGVHATITRCDVRRAAAVFDVMRTTAARESWMVRAARLPVSERQNPVALRAGLHPGATLSSLRRVFGCGGGTIRDPGGTIPSGRENIAPGMCGRSVAEKGMHKYPRHMLWKC